MSPLLHNNWYLVVATAAALLGMLLERLFSRLGHVITVLDALTIGLFGAIGATKALSLGLPEVPAVFVGVLSAVGGSILRDVLLNIPVAIMNVGSLYAVAAFTGISGHRDPALVRHAVGDRRHGRHGDHVRRCGCSR